MSELANQCLVINDTHVEDDDRLPHVVLRPHGASYAATRLNRLIGQELNRIAFSIEDWHFYPGFTFSLEAAKRLRKRGQFYA